MSIKANSIQRITGFSLASCLVAAPVHAAAPIWTFSAPNPASVTISNGGTASITYTVTNQSSKPKTLTLKPTSGLTANSCNLPTKGSTCTLNILVEGSKVPASGIHFGPMLCEQGNFNQCYQPSAANVLAINKNTNENTATLQTSVSTLALSVTGLTEYGIPTVGQDSPSGTARTITITNTGLMNAVGVSYMLSTPLPAGTTITPSSCGTITPQGSCILTVTPGATPSAPPGNQNPIPIVLTISGENTNSVNTSLYILTYASVYQGGYVFALNDSTASTQSVGGKVAALSDQAAAFPNGVIWSSNGNGGNSGDVANNSIYAVSQDSTTSSPSPFNPPIPIPGQTACNGNTDGACNTNNIFVFYPSVNLTFYATGRCQQTIAGYSNWYLPSICEMGYIPGVIAPPSSNCGTSMNPTLQNIQSNLVNNLNLLAGFYFSSTQSSSNPQTLVWAYNFSNSTPAQTNNAAKSGQGGVRCVRAF